MTAPCLGGWCQVRGRCDHYRSTAPVRDDVRLCAKGQERPYVLAPLVQIVGGHAQIADAAMRELWSVQ